MSVQNPERLATKQDLKDMYDRIRPYMGGLVTSKAGFTPIGTIISVMGTTAPVNYLACDGTVYNIADYVELANYFNEQFGSKNFFGGDGTTTFAVPDLRGEFLRGTGTNSHTNQGSGASVGVHQDATTLPQFYSNSANLVYSIQKGINNPDSRIKDRDDGACDYNATSRGTTATYSSTTRPTNTSVLYCIATKNFYIDPTLDYSTEEKIVGTWITGKPLYQKSVQFVVTSAHTSVSNVPTGVVNGEMGIIISGYLHQSDGNYLPVNYYSSSNAFSYAGLTNDISNFRFQTVSGDIGATAIITIQYNKTTD